MSNFNLESLKGRVGQIIGGPEVSNGTGEVLLKFFEKAEPDKGHLVIYTMDADEVLDLAEWLADMAYEAKRRQWGEAHLNSG